MPTNGTLSVNTHITSWYDPLVLPSHRFGDTSASPSYYWSHASSLVNIPGRNNQIPNSLEFLILSVIDRCITVLAPVRQRANCASAATSGWCVPNEMVLSIISAVNCQPFSIRRSKRILFVTNWYDGLLLRLYLPQCFVLSCNKLSDTKWELYL